MTFILLLLNGCTTLPPSAPPSSESWQKRKQKLARVTRWKINGKLAVRSHFDSGSANINWTQKKQSYDIALFGPLGSNNMKLSGKPGEALLIAADGKHYQANSAETLLAQNWGYRLPVALLYYWVRGLPAPAPQYKQTFDQYHRTRSLKQAGWMIEYLKYTRVGKVDLPSLVRVKAPDLSAKLAIYQWKI